jgi:choline dehydrogenase
MSSPSSSASSFSSFLSGLVSNKLTCGCGTSTAVAAATTTTTTAGDSTSSAVAATCSASSLYRQPRLLGFIFLLSSSILGVGLFIYRWRRNKKLHLIPTPPKQQTYDYIVIGGGSAGCVVASRLSEDPKVQVLLLEAGQEDLVHKNIAIPLAAGELQKTSIDWQYLTDPQPHTVDRIHHWPRGKVMGGCSSINWMLYVRGCAADYDMWSDQFGCRGWSYKEVLPYFLRSENRVVSAWNKAALAKTKYHSTSGPLAVTDVHQPNPLTLFFIEAAKSVGIPFNPDYNGKTQLGVCHAQLTIDKGRRCNTSTAFLNAEVRRRPNLTICTQAHVTRITFDSQKKRATGVEFVLGDQQQVQQVSTSSASDEISSLTGEDKKEKAKEEEAEEAEEAPSCKISGSDASGSGSGSSSASASGSSTSGPSGGKVLRAYAQREVVLSAGTVGSAHLLLLSGIGPKDQLDKFEIPVVKDLPVGANMQDHLFVGVLWEISKPLSLSKSTVQRLPNILNYLIHKRGPLSTQALEAMAFIRSSLCDLPEPIPDLQLHHLSSVPGHDNPERMRQMTGIEISEEDRRPEHGFVVFPTLLHPKSRGTVELRSGNPFVPPLINPNYLADERDLATLVEGVKITRKIVASPVYDDIRVRELYDSQLLKKHTDPYSDEYLLDLVRKTALTVYHPVGTCRMGPEEDENTVVNDRLLVHGLENLRVADVSICPEIISGNTNAPAIMIGEKASDLIIEDRLRAGDRLSSSSS